MKKRIFTILLTVMALTWTVPMTAGDTPTADDQEKVSSPAVTRVMAGSLLSSGRSANYAIDWQVLSSGATDGSSPSFTMLGTVGQPATGYGESESFRISHGFWQQFGSGCCRGFAGNVNNDPDDVINIADLTFLVAYQFGGGPEPECFEEGDVNGDASINISDITYMVAYQFGNGPEPPPCP